MVEEKGTRAFREGIRSLKSKDFKASEQKFREAVIRKGPKSQKAELIYQALLIRKECERLLQELKFRF
jgi:TolA-binding protein